MDKELQIGIVVADRSEFEPVKNRLLELGGFKTAIFDHEAVLFSKTEGSRTVSCCAVCCGIGKVNAATATAYLVSNGMDIIISTGFSGGLANLSGAEAVLGTQYLEHDFDLTVLGYKLAQKPDQEYIYPCDELLLDSAKKYFNKTAQGVMVSGDCFISSDEKRDLFINEFNAVACDMETAAVAYVCNKAGVKYLAVRSVSDNAGDSASDDYSATAASSAANWFGKVVDWIMSFTNDERF